MQKGSRKEQILDEIGYFEDEMMTRVTEVQLRAEDMKNLMMFTRGALRKSIEKWILRTMSDDTNILELTAARMGICSYFFVLKLLKINKRKI